MRGRVARIIEDRGFGFISTEDGDYFFHATQVEAFGALAVGDEVDFTPAQDPRGRRRAEKVEPRNGR